MRRAFHHLMHLNAAQIQTIAAVANVVLALAALAGSVAVALYVNKSQSQAERLAFFHSLGEAWINIDLAALSNDDLLVAADNLMDPRNADEPDLNRRRKRWFAYAVMNVVLARYKGAEDGILEPKEEVLAGCRSLLATLVRDDDIYEITQGHGYEPAMQELCRDLRRERIVRSRATIAAPGRAPILR